MSKIYTTTCLISKADNWSSIFFYLFIFFTPLHISAQSPGNLSASLAFWVKANANVYTDAGVTMCLDNNAVQQWGDNSGNGRNAIQLVLTNKPTFKNNSTDNINYNPVISFNGTAQSMVTSDYLTMTSNGCLSTGNNPYSVYLVVRPGSYAAGATPGKILASGACTAANDEFLSFDLRATYAVNDSWDNHDNITTSNKYAANQPIILSFIYKNTVTKRRETFLNGTSVIFTSGAGVGANRNNTNTNNAIGCQLSCSNEFFNGSIGEIASYTVDHTTANQAQVESYLAIKYGITLGGNGGTSNYVNTSGLNIWAGSATYNYDIAVLGKDLVTEGLDQKKSVTSNGTVAVPNDILIIANGGLAGSFASPESMTNNGDYLAMGHNNGSISALSNVTYTQASTVFAKQTARIWRAQKTGTPSGNLVIQIDMSRVNSGTTANNKVALLIDNNTTFGDGSVSEKKYLPASGYSATGGMLTFTVPYSDISSIVYFTLGVAASPLPVEVTSFSALTKNNKVQVQWETASEMNNSHFILKKSSNGISFKELAIISGAGNSSIAKLYSYDDNAPVSGTAYYQLYQIDFDGKTQLIGTIASTSNILTTNAIKIFPQPAGSEIVNVEIATEIAYDSYIEIYTVSGQLLHKEVVHLVQGKNNQLIDISGMENGVYFLRILNTDNTFIQEKLVIL